MDKEIIKLKNKKAYDKIKQDPEKYAANLKIKREQWNNKKSLS